MSSWARTGPPPDFRIRTLRWTRKDALSFKISLTSVHHQSVETSYDMFQKNKSANVELQQCPVTPIGKVGDYESSQTPQGGRPSGQRTFYTPKDGVNSNAWYRYFY